MRQLRQYFQLELDTAPALAHSSAATKAEHNNNRNINNNTSCLRLPALLTAVLLTLALTTAFLGSTSCDFLQINTRDATLDYYYTEHNIGIFCNSSTISNQYSYNEDSVWLASRVSMMTALILGFFSVALSWVLTTVCSVRDVSARVRLWHQRLWRGLGVLSILTTVANVLGFLLFDIEPCKADESSACEIRLGSFLLIVSSVLYVSVVVITECTAPPVLLLEEEEEGYDDGKDRDMDMDWRNVTIETTFSHDHDIERADGESMIKTKFSDLTNSHNSLQLSPGNSINSKRRQVHPMQYHVQPNTAISPAALHIVGNDNDTTNASHLQNVLEQVEPEEEDPAVNYANRLDKHRRQWDTHPDELLVPELTNTTGQQGTSSASRAKLLLQKLTTRAGTGSVAEGYNKLTDEEVDEIEEEHQQYHHQNGYHNVHKSKSYMSGESEAYLLHLLNERRILDHNTINARMEQSVADAVTLKQPKIKSQAEDGMRRRRRGRSITPRSLRPRISKQSTYSAPSTPTGQVHGLDPYKHLGDDDDQTMSTSDSISRVTMDRVLLEARPRSYILLQSQKHTVDPKEMKQRKQPPALPIILSSSSVASDQRPPQTQHNPLLHKKDRNYRGQVVTSSPAVTASPKTALLDSASMISDEHDDFVVEKGKNTHRSSNNNENDLGLHSPLIFNSPRQHQGSPSLLYLGEEERRNAMQKLNTTPKESQLMRLLPQSRKHVITRDRSYSSDDLNQQEKHQDSNNKVVYESPAHRSTRQQNGRPNSAYRHSDHFSESNTNIEESPSRGASLPPVLRMRKLRQKIIRDRFNTSPNVAVAATPEHKRNINNSIGNAAGVVSPLTNGSPKQVKLSPSLQQRDQVSWSVREELGQAKFEWEEQRRNHTKLNRQQNEQFTPPLSPMTSIGGMVEGDDFSYDYRNDRFVSGRGNFINKTYVTP